MKKKTTKTAAKPQGAKEQVRAKLNEQGIAIEMRSLAYQIRMLKVAKLALDAAE